MIICLWSSEHLIETTAVMERMETKWNYFQTSQAKTSTLTFSRPLLVSVCFHSFLREDPKKTSRWKKKSLHQNSTTKTNKPLLNIRNIVMFGIFFWPTTQPTIGSPTIKKPRAAVHEASLPCPGLTRPSWPNEMVFPKVRSVGCLVFVGFLGHKWGIKREISLKKQVHLPEIWKMF